MFAFLLLRDETCRWCGKRSGMPLVTYTIADAALFLACKSVRTELEHAVLWQAENGSRLPGEL